MRLWVSQVVFAEWPGWSRNRSQGDRIARGTAPWANDCSTRSAARNPRAALNVNQVRQLLVGADDRNWPTRSPNIGASAHQRNPRRDQVIAQMRGFLRRTPGDPRAGQEVFSRVCGQCHKIYGAGQDVGPDITLNGRMSVEQLLSNVLDPSLVVGAAYQARIIVTEDGRVLTGLVVEDSPQHSCSERRWPTGNDRAGKSLK